jgi:hypothetical protein
MLSMVIQLTENWNGENEENDEVEKKEMEVKRWKKKRTNLKPIVKIITYNIKLTIKFYIKPFFVLL